MEKKRKKKETNSLKSINQSIGETSKPSIKIN